MAPKTTLMTNSSSAGPWCLNIRSAVILDVSVKLFFGWDFLLNCWTLSKADCSPLCVGLMQSLKDLNRTKIDLSCSRKISASRWSLTSNCVSSLSLQPSWLLHQSLDLLSFNNDRSQSLNKIKLSLSWIHILEGPKLRGSHVWSRVKQWPFPLNVFLPFSLGWNPNHIYSGSDLYECLCWMCIPRGALEARFQGGMLDPMRGFSLRRRGPAWETRQHTGPGGQEFFVVLAGKW